MYLMKRLISFARVEVPEPADEARFAIYPMTVLSPVSNTKQIPFPPVHEVPKNARFLVSRGFSAVNSGFLNKSSDSPVKDALLTFISWHSRILTSAGMLSPSLILTMSPGTK
jgi:hypothetical protein